MYDVINVSGDCPCVIALWCQHIPCPQAITCYSTALEHSEDDSCLLNRGITHVLLGETEKALEDLNRSSNYWLPSLQCLSRVPHLCAYLLNPYLCAYLLNPHLCAYLVYPHLCAYFPCFSSAQPICCPRLLQQSKPAQMHWTLGVSREGLQTRQDKKLREWSDHILCPCPPQTAEFELFCSPPQHNHISHISYWSLTTDYYLVCTVNVKCSAPLNLHYVFVIKGLSASLYNIQCVQY